MSITFSYRESPYGDDLLVIKTNQHVEVVFLYDKGEDATCVAIDGYEFSLPSDTLNGLFVGIGDNVISITDLTREANRQYPGIKEEVERDGREADDMERELSSPYMTGRI